MIITIFSSILVFEIVEKEAHMDGYLED